MSGCSPHGNEPAPQAGAFYRIVVLHYAPIRDTVVGEPPEIFAFLGSSRLEEPLNRSAVTAVFHGHAHHGSLEGQTTGGVPVYNVAVLLLHKTYPARRFAWWRFR